MELDSNRASPVLTDATPVNKSRLGVPSSLLSYPQSGKFTTLPRKKAGKVDEKWSKGWLDAMRSSSPPRKKLTKDHPCVDDVDHGYTAWKLKYPSALNSFEQIASGPKNKIAVFLDYDGTLSPIVDDPDKAFISDAMRSTVSDIAKYFPTAIISGRSRDKVSQLVGLTELYYAGSHGMDILGPVNCAGSNDRPNSVKLTDKQGKEVNLFQPAKEFIPMIDEVFRTLVEKTKGIKGAKVENHKFCASVHYRNVDENNWLLVAQHVHDTLKDYPKLKFNHGRKVLEIRPMIDWNKGKAVEFLLESLGLDKDEHVLPIFIGDDKTDEDAFKVLRKRNQGCGILVSPVAKETNARYSLKDPAEVMAFLESLVKWKIKQEKAQRRSSI
ncbi:hypothetical protein ACFE04_012660 [Oxalis oulophora]